jgi:hypothetical protein
MEGCKMKKCSFVLIVFVLLTFMIFMMGQHLQAAVGKIAGKVTDSETGEPLPGANIIIEGTTIGAATDAEGDYFIINITPGSYDLKASMMGYEIRRVTGVMVNVNQTTRIDFVLTQTTIEGKEVIVIADRPVVQLDVANTQTILTGNEMAALPVPDFHAILDKQAGIRSEDRRGIFIRGSREMAISLSLDGIETRDNVDNQIYTKINMDEVEQAELLTGGFNAEYGNAGAGVISLITKEGGSSYHGTFDSKLSAPARKHFGPPLKDYFDQYYYGPDFDWAARAALINDDSPYAGFKDRPELLKELYEWSTRDAVTKYGDKPDSYLSATFGGPIPFLKNTSFFTSVKRDRSYFLYNGPIDYYQDTNLMAKITSRITSNMKLNFIYRYIEYAGPNRYDRRFLMEQQGIVDAANPNGGNELRYVIDSAEGVAWSGFGGWPYVDMVSISNRYRNQYGLTFTHALSQKTFYDIGLTFNYFKVHGSPGKQRDDTAVKAFGDATLEGPYAMAPDLFWPSQLSDPLSWRIGGTYGDYETSRDKTFSLKGTITSQVNKTNQLNAGFEFNYIDLYKLEDRDAGDNKPYKWLWHVYHKQIALWLSDKLEFEGLIANIGLRADIGIPSSNQPDRPNNPYDYHWADNFIVGADWTDSTSTGPHYNPPARIALAPRLNVSHPIGESAKIFFNYGHYYQEPPLERQYYYMRRHDKPSQCVYGNPELPFQKTIQYEIGYEHNIMDIVRLAATGFYKDNTNIPDEFYYTGLNNQTTPDGKDYVIRYRSYSADYYQSARGLQFRIEKRVGSYWTGWFNYDYELYSRGKLGYEQYFEDEKREPDPYDYEAENRKVTPMPRFNIGMDLHTPSNFGPALGGFRPLADMNLNLLFWWRSQPTFTYDPGNLEAPYDPRDNKRWKAHRATNLVFTKRFPMGNLTPILYLEVYNLFNDKNMFRGAFNSTQLETYMNLLEEHGGEPGEKGDLAREAIGNDPSKGLSSVPYNLYLNPRQFFFGIRLEWR